MYNSIKNLNHSRDKKNKMVCGKQNKMCGVDRIVSDFNKHSPHAIDNGLRKKHG